MTVMWMIGFHALSSFMGHVSSSTSILEVIILKQFFFFFLYKVMDYHTYSFLVLYVVWIIWDFVHQFTLQIITLLFFLLK